jgi:type III pantothenate kinase
MTLTLDIGNTNIKAGYFLRNELKNIIILKNLDELFDSIKLYEFNGAAICSVVPTLTVRVKHFLEEELKLTPYIISKVSLFNLKLDYKTTETLGIDRICSAEAAFEIFNNSTDLEEGTFLLSIDFGTATTINIVAPPNKFIGGLIAPGIKTMFDSLNTKTAQLPCLNFSDYKSLIGEDTNSSIASGIITTTVGMIEKTINHLKESYSAKVIKCFFTGGNARQVQSFLSEDFIYEEALVLKGVNRVYNLNK